MEKSRQFKLFGRVVAEFVNRDDGAYYWSIGPLHRTKVGDASIVRLGSALYQRLNTHWMISFGNVPISSPVDNGDD